MPRNGSGTYVPPESTWNPAVPDVTILSGDWNNLLADMSLAITQSMATDGQSTFSATIPFAQGLSSLGGTSSAPGISIIGDTNTGIYQPANNQIGITANGTPVMLATSSGVTFPQGVTLDGNQTVSGNLTVNGNATIGNAGSDTLTVNAATTFATTVTVPDATFTNAKLANMATATFKGRTTAGSGAPEDLTATQATALLNALVGDSGSGGTKGLAPAPASGDAAAKKFLSAAGTWQPVLAAFGVFSGAGTMANSLNATVSRTGTGAYDVTLSPAMVNANYAIDVNVYDASPTAIETVNAFVSAKSTGGFSIAVRLTDASSVGAVDPDQVMFRVTA